MGCWRGLSWLSLVVLAGCGESDLPRPPAVSAPSSSSGAGDEYFPTQWVGPQTVTVAPGVHVLSRLFPSAVFVIESNQGIVVIDTGVDEQARSLREGFLELGLKVENTRYILLTHAHYDHVFGANKLRSISGATVCAGRDDCQTLRAANQDALFSVFPRQEYSGDPIEIDRELADGDVIELGDVRIDVIAAPGHTPGSMCYLLHKDGQRMLFSGDVIASLNYGPATYPVYISPQYRGDAASYLGTINRLLAMEPPDWLLTGHPRQQRQLYSAKLVAGQWRQLLEPARVELEQVLSRHQQDGADFLDHDAKQIEPGLWYLGMQDGVGVYGLIRNDRLVLINAPGGDRFANFLQSRLQSLGIAITEPAAVLLTAAAPKAWTGLASLKPHPLVVAAESLQAKLAELGIESQAATEWLAELEIEPILLGDAQAYAFSINGRQVLVTPDVPRNLSLLWKNRINGKTRNGGIEPQTAQLRQELRATPAAARAYQDRLARLSKFAPDIWLPATPLTGQNANLYDDRWQWIIEDNRRHLP